MKKIRSFLFYFKKVNKSIIGIVIVCTMLTGLATFGFKESNIEVVDMDEAFSITSELNSQLEAKADLAQEQATGIVVSGDLDAIGTSQIILNTAIAYENPLTEGQEFTSSTTFLKEEFDLKEKIMDVALDLIEHPDIDNLFKDADTFEALKKETAQKLKAALKDQKLYGEVMDDSEIEDLAEGMLLKSVYGESLNYDDLEDIYSDTRTDLEDKEFMAVFGKGKEEWNYEADLTKMVDTIIEATEGIELSDEDHVALIEKTAKELNLILKDNGYGYVLDKSDLEAQAIDIIYSIEGKEELSSTELEVLIKDTKDSIEEEVSENIYSASEEEFDLKEKIMDIALDLNVHPDIDNLFEDADTFEALKKETAQKLKAALGDQGEVMDDSEIEDLAEGMLLNSVHGESLNYDDLEDIYSDTRTDLDDKEFMAVFGKSKEEWNFEADFTLLVDTMKKDITEETEGMKLSDEERIDLIKLTAKHLNLILKDNGYGNMLDKSDLEAKAIDMIYSIEGKKELSSTELEVLIKDTKDSIEKEVSEKFTEFSIPDERDKILKLLEENDLPSDDLTIGIADSVWNILDENISEFTEEYIKNDVFAEILSGLLDPGRKGDMEGSSDIKESIKNELNKNGLLEDQTLIESREALNKAKNYEEFLQKEISHYDSLEAKGYVIVDSWHYDSLKNSLKDILVKISELESESVIAEEEAIIAEEDLVEEDIEEEPIKEEAVATEETPETSAEKKESEETTEEVPGEVIVLNGTYSGPDYPDFGSFTMYMSIDLKTGTVSGMASVIIKNENVDLDYNFPISGSMNLETREITGKFGDDKMNGKLSADGNRANGTGEEGIVWSVSR